MRNNLDVADRAAVVTRDPRWAALISRDPAADGLFYYSVETTGVYCRPTCAARLARPENVRFHKTCEDAEAAGFRPCKRCRPGEASLGAVQSQKIAAACRLLERSEEVPTLAELAQSAGLSPYHFHRLFKAATGLTPKRYGAAQRDNRVRKKLAGKSSVTEAIYAAGHNSSGSFYRTANQVLGMTPSRYRSGGARTNIRFAVGESSLGAILVAQSDRGICAILLGDDPEALTRNLQDRFPKAELSGGDLKFEKLVAKVVGLIETPARGLALPLDIRGTAFQQRVWEALRQIAPGTTASYSEIAMKIGAPKSVRAVARACAANALAVAIPCHRVVRIDGSISGYRWGVDRKKALLEREARASVEE